MKFFKSIKRGRLAHIMCCSLAVFTARVSNGATLVSGTEIVRFLDPCSKLQNASIEKACQALFQNEKFQPIAVQKCLSEFGAASQRMECFQAVKAGIYSDGVFRVCQKHVQNSANMRCLSESKNLVLEPEAIQFCSELTWLLTVKNPNDRSPLATSACLKAADRVPALKVLECIQAKEGRSGMGQLKDSLFRINCLQGKVEVLNEKGTPTRQDHS